MLDSSSEPSPLADSSSAKDLTSPPKRVAFLQNITDQLLAYAFLASGLTERGHQVKVFVENFENDLLAAVHAFKPDVLGAYCTSSNDDWVISTLKRYKEIDPNCLVIAGGPHPTFHPDSFTGLGLDALCIGEGDHVIISLTERWDGTPASVKGIENTWVFDGDTAITAPKGRLIENLDDLPLPDRSIYDHYDYYETLNTLPVITMRGCPFSCTYCYMNASRKIFKGLGRAVRYRKPETVLKEILNLKKRYKNMDFIVFADSTLNVKGSWFRELMDVLAKDCNIPFFCHVRADIMAEDQFERLKKAGCRLVALGIEAGSERLRRDVLKRPMTDEQILFTVDGLRKQNINIGTANMFALPTETLDETYALIRLNQKIKAEQISSTVFQPYPGTEISDFVYAEGLADISMATNKNYYHHSPLKHPNAELQSRLQKLLYYYVHFPRLEPLWEFCARKMPFAILCWMFYIGLTLSIKRGYGYSWFNILGYALRNLKLYSAK